MDMLIAASELIQNVLGSHADLKIVGFAVVACAAGSFCK